jgi:Flp pilus assembly protein TadG
MRRQRARGFVLLTLAAGLVLLVGVTGLVVDLGRLYIAQNELQAAADAAALAAVYELDGTAGGIERAVSQVQSNPNRWNFGTQEPEFTVTFAASAAGPFVSDPAGAAEVRYLQVGAKATVPTYFVPAVTSYQNMAAVARAGQTRTEALADNWFPYAAEAPNGKNAEFGYQAGRQYPLRLIDVGGGIGPHYQDAVRQAILSGMDGRRVAAGDRLRFGEPDWETEAAAFDERLAQDTDQAAEKYADYTGNGRRFVIMPVNDPASDTVAGFAGFFLPPGACGEKEPQPCQAEYVGAALLPGRKGAGPVGAYRISLIQ